MASRTCPEVSFALKERFGATHCWDEVEARERNFEDFPRVHFLPVVDRPLALAELRNGPQTWILLSPNSQFAVGAEAVPR